jgi:hypothetical protein
MNLPEMEQPTLTLLDEIKKYGPQEGDEPAVPDAPSEPGKDDYEYIPFSKKKPKRSKLKTVIAALVVLLLAAGGAGYFFLPSAPQTEPVISAEEHARIVQEISINRRRQYIKENRHLGRIIVIDGTVVNTGENPKNFIKLEAAIIDPIGAVVLRKEFYAGPGVSQLQLESLSEAELEKWLTNETEIFRANTNVQQGDSVPFMVVFFRPPPKLLEEIAGYSYRLTVVDAQEM